MELTMKAAIWQVMVDVSVMGALLLIGEFLRAKVKLFQKVLIPPAVIAGFLALLFGPKSPVEALRILPLSSSFGTYASVLIVVIFAATHRRQARQGRHVRLQDDGHVLQRHRHRRAAVRRWYAADRRHPHQALSHSE